MQNLPTAEISTKALWRVSVYREAISAARTGRFGIEQLTNEFRQ